MTESISDEGVITEPAPREGIGSIVALCAIAASTMIVEITATKFLSFKLFHHMTFAILGVVVLSFGVSGILSYSNPNLFGLQKGKIWSRLGMFAVLYGIAIDIAIPIFCWCPLSPYEDTLPLWLRVASTPIIFCLIAVPMFLAGLCVSQTLAESKRPVGMIYFWDLLFAAVGALVSPMLLTLLGGYGTMALCGVLGIIAGVGYWQAGADRNFGKQGALVVAGLLSALLCLAYPSLAIKAYGIDITTFKDIGPKVVLRDFGGIDITSWNPIARVDVSHTGTSKIGTFRYGLSKTTADQTIFGRYVLLDGGASTRQFRADGDVHNAPYLSSATWATVYVAKPEAKDVCIIGGGGGVDILCAKYHNIPNLTVIELNPSIYKLLTGKFDPPDHSYVRWLGSDQTTKVKILNDEARHFSTTVPPESFDVLQSSGVDTLTAIQTGGMSLTENYLYTIEAVRDFMRMVKPDGIVAITHWRTERPGTALRLFGTYLAYLDSIGVKDPAKHIVVIGGDCTASLIKKSPFTPEELQRLREWAKKAQLNVVFDPERRTQEPGLYPGEKYYNDLAFCSAQERQHLFDTVMQIPPPVTDDKPYFYTWRYASDGWVLLNQTVVPTSLLVITILFGLFAVVAPALNVGRFKLTPPMMWSALYFTITGFAFLLYETAIIQMFGIFVGGPMYALTVVLVSVLIGYAIGGWIVSRIVPRGNFFYISAASLGVMFVALYFIIPQLTHQLLFMDFAPRLMVCAALSTLCTIGIGIVVSSAMTIVRERFHEVVAWMWGISAVANAIGAVSFITITQNYGISSCLIICAVCYFVANVLFAMKVKRVVD